MTKPAVAFLALLLLAGCGKGPMPTATALGAGDVGALAATGNGVTPALAAALGTFLDKNGDGQIQKQEGFVELVGPGKESGRLSNYYDADYKRGEHVKPVPVKTLVEKLGQGHSLTLKAIKGEKEGKVYDIVAMTPKERDAFIDGIADVLATSPLYKKALLGGSIPVRHVVTPHYLFRKATDEVGSWSMSKVRSMMEKVMGGNASAGVTIVPGGTHKDGAFVLEVRQFPAI